MRVVAFHQNLLGQDQDRTPEAFRLRPIHQNLYEAFDQDDARGFWWDKDQEDDQLLATLVLALSQTIDSDGQLYRVDLISPRNQGEKVKQGIEKMARRVFRQRKGDLASVTLLRKAFNQLTRSERPLQIDIEPKIWFAFGFEPHTLKPPWMNARFIPDERPSAWERLDV